MDESPHYSSHQFRLKQTLFGYVVMFRETIPDYGIGDFRWTKWRKATWDDMLLFAKEKLQ